MVNRVVSDTLLKRLADKKVLVLIGPRQVGKTTLLNELNDKFKQPVLWWNGDNNDIRTALERPGAAMMRKLIGNAKTIVIDEAQRIENIGLSIKIIYDQIPGVKVIATGSSAFDLANKLKEPLTGRKWEYNLFPFSFGEMANHNGLFEEKALLKHRMIFGYYPAVVNAQGNEIEILKSLSDSYLYKDILIWERLNKPEKLEKLVQALAFQVGQQVSYNELGQLCGLNNETVEKYISLLEKAFIVFRLTSLSRNLRNELKQTRKIYFYDNGMRNAVINQFNALEMRNDVGALWENFIVSERRKFINYYSKYCNQYFWRNHAQQEIDYIEEHGGAMDVYEFKWSAKGTSKIPKVFSDAYKVRTFKTINQDNFLEFVMK